MRDEAYESVMEMLKECLADARRIVKTKDQWKRREIPDPVAATWWEGDTFFLRLSSPEKKNRMTYPFNKNNSVSYDVLTNDLLEWY